MNVIRQILNVITSVRLTVALLACSLALIFFGTLDQVNMGIRGAQKEYFESFFGIWKYPPQWWLGSWFSRLGLPVPGGYLIGPLLVVNLTLAHFRYFRPSWKKAGIVMIHTGVVLLLISQLLTNILQEESTLWINEGGTANYMESYFDTELVIIDKSDPETDGVVSIPTKLFARNRSFQHPKLPFRIRIDHFYPNSALFRNREEGGGGSTAQLPANKGLGVEMGLTAKERPKTSRQNEKDVPAAVVELIGTEGSLGTWLVSAWLGDDFPAQTVLHAGKVFEIALRLKREYLPYTIELIDFTHDRYPGTEIPKNFSSKIRLKNSQTGEDRQVLIYMNHPLRYAGLTFFQASFTPDDKASMLQVVRNPGWLIPYISCTLVSLGLLFQFGYHLIRFTQKQKS